MKESTIKIVGKHITENDDELEEGYIEIEVEAYDILRELDSEDVADYARWSLDMKHEDDFESSLDDFDNDDFVKALKSSGYNFAQQVTEEDCIEVLEVGGYVITDENDEENRLDYVCSRQLEEIKEKFLEGNWSERESIYNKIIYGN